MCLSRNNPRLRASNLYQRPHGDIHCSECLDDCSTSACRLSTRAYELSSGVRDRLEGRVFKGGRVHKNQGEPYGTGVWGVRARVVDRAIGHTVRVWWRS